MGPGIKTFILCSVLGTIDRLRATTDAMTAKCNNLFKNDNGVLSCFAFKFLDNVRCVVLFLFGFFVSFLFLLLLFLCFLFDVCVNK